MGNNCQQCEPYIEKASEVEFVRQGISYAKQGVDYAKQKIPLLNDLLQGIGTNEQPEEGGKVGEYPNEDNGPNIEMDPDFLKGQPESNADERFN